MTTPTIHHPTAIDPDHAQRLVDRYRDQQLAGFRSFRVLPGTGLFVSDPDDFGPSYTVSGAYPDGSYRITMRPGTGGYDGEERRGRPTVIGYPNIPPPTETITSYPPGDAAIYRPEAMSEAAALHLVERYRHWQLDAVSPSHGRIWFRRRSDASIPTERVTGAYPDGSYLIESFGGWRGDGPLSVVWSHDDIDPDEGFVGTTQALRVATETGYPATASGTPGTPATPTPHSKPGDPTAASAPAHAANTPSKPAKPDANA